MEEGEDLADPKVRETLSFTHAVDYGWDDYKTTHRLTVAGIIKYLRKNPTLDESQPPLSYSPACRQYKGSREDAYDKRIKTAEKLHVVPWAALRAHIDQHPELKAIFEGAQPAPTVVETVIVDRPFAMTDAEKAELALALHRQQHIRNEYVRRAYLARQLSAETGNEAVYQAELDTQLAGMKVLREFMERLDIPAADWLDNELALAQMALLEGKEVTDDLHVPKRRSHGESGLAAGRDRAVGDGGGTSQA